MSMTPNPSKRTPGVKPVLRAWAYRFKDARDGNAVRVTFVTKKAITMAFANTVEIWRVEIRELRKVKQP